MPAGRYYLAVGALDGADGAYTLRRHARAITTTKTLANGLRKAVVGMGQEVRLALRVTPSVTRPATLLFERFDPIDGWLFDTTLRPTLVSGRATANYRPAGLGRWRVTGSFDGTYTAGPSAGGTAGFAVVEPLTLRALGR
ncbi:MAG: hypothetical protein LH461_08235 [Spirochaetaceae bacterium]|nr:hypothetical protein [Spirochaetaceae bacterium]